MSQRTTLLSNASATGSAVMWNGGRGQLQVSGTFGGATVTLQILGPDGATYLSVGADAALTDVGVVNFDLPPGLIRAHVASGSPSALYALVSSV